MPSRAHRIAVITPLELEYSGRLLEGVVQYAHRHPHITVLDMPYAVDAPNHLRLRAPWPFDAAVVWATHEARWVEQLRAAGIPLMSCSSDLPVDQVPCTSFSSGDVVAAALDHLQGRQPAVVVNLEFRIAGVPAKEARTQLFAAAARARRLDCRIVQVFRRDGKDDTPAARRLPLAAGAARRLHSLLRSLPRPAAIWCGDDVLAAKVCDAAGQLGLRVPEDIAVLGLGDFRIASIHRPRVSTIPLPGEHIGYRAVDALCRHLKNHKPLARYTAVPPPPVISRESTGSHGDARDPVSRARAFLSRHGAEGPSVPELAAAAGLTPQSLHDLFVRKLGHPPGEAIRRARLDAAKRHLADPRLSIARVAHLCGFNQQSKFASFFRRGTGESPRTWRQGNVMPTAGARR